MLSNGEHSSASHSLPGSKPLLKSSTDIKKVYASFISKRSARKKQSIGRFDKQAVNVRIPVLKSSKVNIPPDLKIHNLRTSIHSLSATIEHRDS